MNITSDFTSVEISNQLQKICASKELRSKRQLCKLLKYLVTEATEGRGNSLKGYTIGLDVFNKDVSFDSDSDPIVRINAGRLRQALKLHYLDEGKDDQIKIDIPKGKYIPIFSYQNRATEKNVSIKLANNTSSIEPSVVILPFKNLSNNLDEDYFALGLSEELSVEFTKYEYLTTYGSSPFAKDSISDDDKIEFIKNKGIRFIVEGGVNRIGNQIKVFVRLIDSNNGKQLWANHYTNKLTPLNIINIQETICTEVACILGSEYGVILQHLALNYKCVRPKEIGHLDAILKYHYYEIHQSPEAGLMAFTALDQALKTESDSALSVAMLACMYATQYLLDTSDDPTLTYEQLCTLSDKALNLEPNCKWLKIVLVVKYFIEGEKELFLIEIDKCLAMNLNSPLRLGNIGQYLALFGEWERGKQILDRVIEMNVSYPLYILGVTALYYYRKGEYNKALIEAKKYQMPALFWGPLLRAATLGQLNRITEAEPNITHLKELKPNFENEARYLISRFIKENELADHVMDGLQKAGMKISYL